MGVGAGFLGKGIELWRKTGGVSTKGKGKREARRERNLSAVGLFALSLFVVFSMLALFVKRLANGPCRNYFQQWILIPHPH